MKKKIVIVIIILFILVLISGLTNYIDGARVRNGAEPICCIRIVSEDDNKITYLGIGYKVIRYPSVSPNEPFRNNRGIKMGNWFMNYEPEEYSVVNVYYEGGEETEYPEKIYEDDAHVYYLPYIKSENIIVEESNKARVDLKEALLKEKISIDKLTNEFNIKIIVEKKLLNSAENISNIPNVKFLANKPEEEIRNKLMDVHKRTIYELWGEPNGKITGWDYDYWNINEENYPIIISYNNDVITGVTSTLKVTHDEFCLVNDEMRVVLNAEMTEFNKEPIEVKEERMDGFHWKDYKYDDIEIRANLNDENNRTMITKILTSSDKYKTLRGIKVGDNLELLKELYPDDLIKALTNPDENVYIYEPQDDLGFNRIYFYLENDVITEIKIENGIDG